MRANGEGKAKSAHGESFVRSAAAGALFGLIASLFFVSTQDLPVSPVTAVLGAAAVAGGFSGLAGFGGSHLDAHLEHRGFPEAARAVMSFAAVAILTLTLVAAATLLGIISPDPYIQRFILWGAGLGTAFGAVVAVSSFRGELVRRRVEMLEMENRHLAEINRREELLRETARNLVVSEERNRMAREIHDSISQGVHGIVFSLRSLGSIVGDDPRGREILDHLEETAEGTLDELRRMVRELTPSSLEDRGLAEAVRLAADLVARRAGLELETRIDYPGGLTPEAEMAVYRIAQEAMANVERHARACGLKVSLRAEGDAIRLVVADDGVGFEIPEGGSGFGLDNMITRARRSDGSLQISATPGEGTRITATFPKTTPGTSPAARSTRN